MYILIASNNGWKVEGIKKNQAILFLIDGRSINHNILIIRLECEVC